MPNSNHKSWNANSAYGKHNNSGNYAQNRSNGSDALLEIKTPYSFVPIPDQVYFPEWSGRISQDVPFLDGLSGTISFNLVSQTPVFVRDNQDPSSFCKTSDGRFFIPATSLKGEIESVLRILSFGKVGKVANASFGLRDLSNSDAGRGYRNLLKNIRCGWMRISSKSPSGFEIEDWGTPYRISVEKIADFLFTGDPGLSMRIWDKDYFNDDDFHRTALHKYQLADFEIGTDPINDDMFIWSAEGNDKKIITKVYWKVDSENYPEPDLSKGNKGVIVFTGQPSARSKKEIFRDGKRVVQYSGKHREFFFMKPQTTSTKYPKDDVIKAFFSINEGAVDFEKFRRIQLQKGFSIPVFFIENKGVIHSIGLTAMYKYPFAHSVYDALPAENRDLNKRDLIECIFGFASDDSSSKGRGHFGHAFAINSPRSLEEKAFHMSQPRASFYPFYVNNGENWDKASLISGWKRYPVRGAKHILPSPTGTTQMQTRASMLPTGTIFKETIRFHNLKPCELGALISAITFHANSDKCLHSIGFGKPLGYGAMKVENLELKDRDGISMEPNIFMGEFERIMTQFKSDWLASPQLTELMLMARGIPEDKFSSFKYLDDPKDFYNLKKSNITLAPFSKRIGSTFTVKSLLTK